jgi:magnesium transporter
MSPRLQLLLESLQKLVRRGAYAHVARLLKRARPADVAVVLRFLDDRHHQRIFDLLPDDEARAETLVELDSHLIEALVGEREPSFLAGLVRLMSADDQADVLAELPEELRQTLIDLLKPDEAEELEDLLGYDEETAGGIMSPDYFALPDSTTVGEAVAALQAADQDDIETAFYIYAVNEHGHLVGVVSLRALVINPVQYPLAKIMATDIISADVNTDQEEVARLAARYNLLAVPVVDEGNHLVGIVTIDDVIDVIREEATEDILKMAGADETAFEGYSVLKNVKTRAPWLFATWLGGLAASMLIGVFEAELQSTVALAAFIPIVLGMGGNVGMQTATIMVRGLATGRVSHGVGSRYLLRETGIGVMLGLLYGALLAGYAAVRYASDGAPVMPLAFTVGISILASMTAAASMGAATPLVFDRLNIDPAIATGPIVTTTVDVVGILVYFLAAAAFINGV